MWPRPLTYRRPLRLINASLKEHIGLLLPLPVVELEVGTFPFAVQSKPFSGYGPWLGVPPTQESLYPPPLTLRCHFVPRSQSYFR